MSTLTLIVRDIKTLNEIQKKLSQNKQLSANEKYLLNIFLRHLPSTETLLEAKFPLEEKFEIKVFDIKETRPHMEKWINLFNSLPKNGNTHYPSAGWLDTEEDPDFWITNVIIGVAFIPSFAHWKKSEDENQIVSLYLKSDGTAIFELYTIEDAEIFPELYNFKGTWKEAYLLTIKTLQRGWPQTMFPEELQQFLKK